MDKVSQQLKPFSWRAITAIIFTIAFYFLSQFAAVVLLGIYAGGAKHLSAQAASSWLENSVGAQFGLVVLVEAITLGLLYLFLRRYKLSFSDLGLKRPKLRDGVYALAGFAAYFPIYVIAVAVIQALVPGLNIDQKQQLGFSSANGSLLVLVFFALVVLPPLTEEILVRGFLYGSLKKHWTKWQAILTTSILFALAHLQFGSGAPLLWIAAIDTFILSLVLIYLRDKTGGLAASIGLHMLKNGLAFAALFIFRAG